jgi:hypothetical protein
VRGEEDRRKGGWGFQGEGSLTRARKQSERALVLLSADGDTTTH